MRVHVPPVPIDVSNMVPATRAVTARSRRIRGGK